ncbi:PREDICTED: FAS1 domain-containing protein SELMODRAFT_448915 [Nelumbo nucifera]|uniref:FAS1 domain-containing protein n=2 Tax=Nelumbo nucifera TaxID=4432 RepID=A0A822XM26_NELNU|nr:PREDICTED: FAS1 domain-containing protein SELMODRAFT_448915 [Nelumbo nucifera]DAD20261.1 TPA_asm: hypothetical protein HUJ06_021724 [Nelumbo nucifera]
MGFHLFIFLALLTIPKSEATANRTDLHVAMAEMRSKSYYSFVMLLELLHSNGSQPQLSGEVTFLMPEDRKLSEFSVSVSSLRNFILSHTIPTPLNYNDFLHFPTGTLIPSGIQTRMITIQNHGRSNFLVNNAQIVAPNVCQSSSIRCHGIDKVIEY